jgi:glycosyltransferase involved in cell wall biosynthesis
VSPDRRLRLVVVSHNLFREGAPRVLFEIVRGLKEVGAVAPRLLTLEDGPMGADFRALGCPVARLSTRSAWRTAWDVARVRPDVVLANTIVCHRAVTAAVTVRVPALWLIHESQPPFSLLPAAEREPAQRALEHADRVVFPAAATRDLYAPLAGRARLDVAHNGFDHATFAAAARSRDRAAIRARWGVAPDVVVGAVVGTINERKAQLDAVRAAAALAPEVAARLVLFLVGDVPGPYGDQVRAAAAELAPGRVRIVPFAEDVLDWYVGADFVVSTSRVESFPRVVCEAMWFGLPLVVAPVFGIREQVEDGVSALFFPPGDVAALAERMTRIIGDAALRARLGTAAKAALARLPTLDDSVRTWQSWLEQAVARRPAPWRRLPFLRRR